GLDLSVGLHLGALHVYSSHRVDRLVPADSGTTTPPVRSITFFLMPEVAAVLRLRPYEVGIGARLSSFLRDVPPLVDGSDDAHLCPGTTDLHPSCTLDSPKAQRAYGPFVLVSPQLRFSYFFY